MLKSIKIVSIVLSIIIALPLLLAVYFFVSNEAPIINGTVLRNLNYSATQALDIYTPTKQKYDKSPVLVFIHGGAWIGGSKESININRYNEAVNSLRDTGYTVVSINYTLATKGNSPFPQCITDAEQALHWIAQHADSFNLDLNNIGLFGESAGAHIAMMLAFQKQPNSDFNFNYLIDVYGPNQLEGVYHTPLVDSVYTIINELPKAFQSNLDIANYLFGFDPEKDSARAYEMMQAYSPFNFLTASAPTTLLIHGSDDQLVPIAQTTALAEKLQELKIPYELHLMQGVNHGFIAATPQQIDSVQQWITTFVVEHYKQ